MAKRNIRYPHTIAFRVTDETWFKIQRETSQTDLTPNDWCRSVVLDRLDKDYGLSKNERFTLHQVVRTQWLIANGLQLLADEKLTTEEWKKLRKFARENAEVLLARAVDNFGSEAQNQGPTFLKEKE